MSDELFGARFPKLSVGNFAEWRVMMEAELTRRRLWTDIVEVEVDGDGKSESEILVELTTKLKGRDKQKMAEARAEMILRVDIGQLAHMDSKDPREIWGNLQTVHRAQGFATSLSLRRKFLTAKMLEGQGMESWVGQIRRMAKAMELAGIDVSDQDLILALTMGLPPSYENVIINFDATPPDQLTLSNVIVRLLNEETRQASLAPGHSEKDKEEEEDVAAIAFRNGKAKGNSRVDFICFFCDKPGHLKADCEERAKWWKSKKRKTAAADFAGLAIESDSDVAF